MKHYLMHSLMLSAETEKLSTGTIAQSGHFNCVCVTLCGSCRHWVMDNAISHFGLKCNLIKKEKKTSPALQSGNTTLDKCW